MNFLVDSHCHLYNEYYENIDKVIKESNDLNVKYFIVDGVDDKSNKEVLELSKKYECIFVTLGIHPEEADNYEYSDLQFIENNINNNKVVAIGEIGLDYHYDNVNKEKQIELFELQLKLAEKYNMPVVIHCRDAYFDTINLLKKYKVKGVIHCFSGSLEIAREFVKLGFYLGITGVITFKNAKLINVVKELGIENFILETDSPYLTPYPFRGKTNIPGNTYYVAKYLEDNLNVSINEITSVTNSNIIQIFDKIKFI